MNLVSHILKISRLSALQSQSIRCSSLKISSICHYVSLPCFQPFYQLFPYIWKHTEVSSLLKLIYHYHHHIIINHPLTSHIFSGVSNISVLLQEQTAYFLLNSSSDHLLPPHCSSEPLMLMSPMPSSFHSSLCHNSKPICLKSPVDYNSTAQSWASISPDSFLFTLASLTIYSFSLLSSFLSVYSSNVDFYQYSSLKQHFSLCTNSLDGLNNSLFLMFY